jgi:hypothetical protein
MEFYEDKSKRGGRQPNCKACVAARSKVFYKKNKVRLTAYHKAYREQNKQRRVARDKAWYEQNKEIAAERRRAWREQNPAKSSAMCRRYQAKKLNATPAWVDTSEILDFYEAARAFRIYTGQEYHVDHIVPLQGKTVCGLHVPANLQVLPLPENTSKQNRHWPDMWEKI